MSSGTVTEPAPHIPASHGFRFRLALTVVAVIIPIVAARWALGSSAMTMLLFGALAGYMNTITGGRRVGAAAAVAFVLAAPIALVAGQDPIAGASVMTLACLLVGFAVYFKRYSGFSILLVGILFIVTSPSALADKFDGGTVQEEYLLSVLVGTAICAFWPVLIVPALHGAKNVPRSMTNAWMDTTRYAVSLAILVGLTTFYAIEWGADSHGVWLPLTLLMVMQVQPGSTPYRSAHRVAGTIAGTIFVSVYVTVFHNPWATGVLLIAATLALIWLVGSHPYWRWVFAMTVLVVGGVSAGEPVLDASAERIVYTLIGSAIALAVYGLKIAVLHPGKSAQPHPAA